MTGADPYLRLRAAPATPPEETCACPGAPPLVLMVALGPNPLHCLACHLEVAPERVPVPLDLVDELASWCSIHDALDRLYLDSAEYEAWARAELADLTSPSNRRGQAVRARLDPIRRCYYWCFRDDDAPPPAACPSCGGPLRAHPHLAERRLCDTCSLVS